MVTVLDVLYVACVDIILTQVALWSPGGPNTEEMGYINKSFPSLLISDRGEAFLQTEWH